MNYQEKVTEMLLHISSQPENVQQNLDKILCAFGNGVADALCMIEDHDQMHKIMGLYLASLAAFTCANHQEFAKYREQQRLKENNLLTEEEVKPMSFAEFLRDVFKPDHLND